MGGREEVGKGKDYLCAENKRKAEKFIVVPGSGRGYLYRYIL